ncbi:MAG: LVIVD repeat-containing protein [Halanaeroarchaeum sp.]
MRGPRRRDVLKLSGALGLASLTGVAGAIPDHVTDGTLRRFGEVAVDGSSEVVTQGNWAYVATGDGFAVVDWGNPARPKLAGTWDAPGTGIADVTVDGDLLAVSNQDAADDAILGTHLYDVSDPTEPRHQGSFQVTPAGVHNAFLADETLYISKEAPFTESAFVLVDVSDPTDPTEYSRWVLEDVHPDLDSITNFVHDAYVQDEYAYLAYWDAGCRVLDVSDPTDPVEVSAFGQAPGADRGDEGDPVGRLFGYPGNAHYVQPSPDGDHVYVGAETYAVRSGGVRVFDVTDFDDPRHVATIQAPNRNPGIFADTAHNFDVTDNRLYTSWYRSGARVHDVTDPANPERRYEYDPEGAFFWTTVRDRGFTVASDIGGGLVFLHEDRGRFGPPAFEGADTAPHHDRLRRD